MLSDALKAGLAHGEFRPYFQPVVSAVTRQITGCEILARWHHPVAGVLLPQQFIPQAEATGLIVPLTWQLMSQATQCLRRMTLGLPGPFHVGVNITPAHCHAPELETECRKFQSAFPAGNVRLMLELTERTPFPVTAASVALLNRLHGLGVRFALDDFGTGYAGFSYLQTFPVDCIKLDKRFVRLAGTDETSGHIVDSILVLARRLNLTVIAEGIETAEQEALMTEKGVSRLQGYRYAPPLPGGRFLEEWLSG